MKRKALSRIVFLAFVIAALSLSGCSNMFKPSDKEVIEAINSSGVFKGGFGGMTLQAPITILEKGSRNKDGSWPVKVKVVITVYKTKDQVSEPMERTVVFNIRRVKDSAGRTVWKAELAP